MSHGRGQKLARTFRRSSCKRGVFLLFQDFRVGCRASSSGPGMVSMDLVADPLVTGHLPTSLANRLVAATQGVEQKPHWESHQHSPELCHWLCGACVSPVTSGLSKLSFWKTVFLSTAENRKFWRTWRKSWHCISLTKKARGLCSGVTRQNYRLPKAPFWQPRSEACQQVEVVVQGPRRWRDRWCHHGDEVAIVLPAG